MREYIQSLLEDGISFEDLLDLLGECLKRVMYVIESLVDLEITAANGTWRSSLRLLCYYWAHNEKFSLKDFFHSF